MLAHHNTNLGFLGAWSPLIADFHMVYKENGKAGIKNLLKKGIDLIFKKKWWVVILLLFPSHIFIAYIISSFAVIGNSVTIIGVTAFIHNKITSIIIPSLVKVIGRSTFSGTMIYSIKNLQ